MAPLRNISSVMPGIVAMRAPAFTASFFALVCVMDVLIGQSTTSAFAIAAAIAAGGSCPETARGFMVTKSASAPSPLAAS